MVVLFNRDLLDRTLGFSKDNAFLIREVKRDIVTIEICKQLAASSFSGGANYREACEAESVRDFVHKMKIAKKEVREAKYWLKLLLAYKPEYREMIVPLIKE